MHRTVPFLSLLLACGGSASVPPSPSPAADADAGTGSDACALAACEDAASALPIEFDVNATSYDALLFAGGPRVEGGTVAARFATPTTGGVLAPIVEVNPSCTYTAVAPNFLMYAYANAGPVSLSLAGAAIATATPKADSQYALGLTKKKIWSGGETLHFEAKGGPDLKGFTADVVAPSQGTITAPTAPAAGQKMTITRVKDITMSWTGGGVGKLRVRVLGGDGTGLVTCELDASKGSGVIPKEGLSLLVAGTAGGFVASFVSVAKVNVDTRTVTATLSTPPKNADGTGYPVLGAIVD